MPTPGQIDDMLQMVVDDAVISIAGSATTLQITLESYLASLSGLDEDVVRDMVYGDEASVASGAASAAWNRARAVILKAIASAYGTGMTAAQLERNAAAELYTWVTTSGNPCPDCNARAGEQHTMEEWELIGRPQSGFSVCGANCRCRLDSQHTDQYTYEKG